MTSPTRIPGGFSRRRLLKSGGASLFLASLPLCNGARASLVGTPRSPEGEKLFDLVIKGGKVIDPAQDIDTVRDVAVRAGKIARVGQDIPASEAGELVDARGKIVTPGLIDLHTHVFPYVGPYGVEPDPSCVAKGVTTALDAGTVGAFAFPAFRRFVIERAATRIRVLLHVVSLGLVAGGTPNMGELEDLRYCDPKLAARVARENPDLIVGLKIRFSQQYTGANDLEGMKRARAAADEANLPLMIHIGGSYSPVQDFLALMKKGDVVTHSFNSHPHGVLDSAGKIVPEVLQARQRGVLFDVGHGAGSFSFEVMEKCLQQAFLPDTISTDLHTYDINGPVFDMPTTLSKFLLLGLSLRDVVAQATVNAARAFSFGANIGSLKPGADADISVLELRDGDFAFIDSDGKKRTARQKLVPIVTVRGGKLFHPTASLTGAG
jgi:dihydroorotase